MYKIPTIFKRDREGNRKVFDEVPSAFEGLREWLPRQKSKIGRDCRLEGIVWHGNDGRMCKIKVVDFA